MGLSIEELGITREELVERVVERVCHSLLTAYESDEDGNPALVASQFNKTLQQTVKKQADEKISAIAEAHILPQVTNFVEGLVLQETNKWGEKTGKALTFIEYLTSRAEAYMKEQVSHDGKSKDEADLYGWSGKQTRITYLVHKHLQYSIETAMKEAMKNANSLIAAGIQETVKIQLEQVAKTIRVAVITR